MPTHSCQTLPSSRRFFVHVLIELQHSPTQPCTLVYTFLRPENSPKMRLQTDK